ncbi:LOW QUALITY PROTEIN: bile salt-activated lipase-like [Gymnodraco acuticeps]|uniref:Carboxylic ester hydrolase n=1 Tax=Gymnodraco acuticeps TaxID=8218 RepID=A0A6P8T349_GYMAC|nr:LOW QUALITY PROTEIN: bile salt-activated lipase-like [Gymnodraco acuticeps]
MMKMKMRSLVAIAVFLETVYAISLGVVNTEGGLVRGENIALEAGRHMDIFKGIPFADVPETLMKPKPHPGWDDVLDATAFKDICLQMHVVFNTTTGSTDCLYLNIWVPHNGSVSSDMPVMVWIYGGAFLIGSATGIQYIGQELAGRGNVIVVSIGYRVGSLGFLSTGEQELPGNYGLWDQQAAIAWVHRNIRKFGGDPENITIFGESAGGVSVSLQTLSPHNKGLFKRAISQSGVAVSPWVINKNPREYAVEVALKVKCPTDEGMASCLKEMDPVVLTLVGSFNLSRSASEPILCNLELSPVIDGDFLPDHPSKLFHNAADIDFIAGVNDMDGYFFTSIDIPSVSSDQLPVTVEAVEKLLAAFIKDKGDAALQAALSLYNSTWEPTPSQESIKKTLVHIETDFLFLASTQAALKLHADNAKTGRTYSYLFSEPNQGHISPIFRPFPQWMGADHTDDVPYVFGKPYTAPLLYLAESHRDLSGYMIAYWTNFARTGDPNEGELSVPATWPTFNSTGQKFVELNSKMNESYVGENMRMPFVDLWTNVIPNIIPE